MGGRGASSRMTGWASSSAEDRYCADLQLGLRAFLRLYPDQSPTVGELGMLGVYLTPVRDKRESLAGIVKLMQKIARLCSKERTTEDFGLSRTPVFSLY